MFNSLALFFNLFTGLLHFRDFDAHDPYRQMIIVFIWILTVRQKFLSLTEDYRVGWMTVHVMFNNQVEA